jgi:molybdopterin-guanine dinucleotide biosynthesis protein A
MKLKPEVCGLVLAGGKSERMGIDKGLLDVHGESMREYMIRHLGRVCAKVYTSCRFEQQVPLWMNPILDDQFTAGPLNGLLSAFNHDSGCAWLTVAVDMPYVDTHVLRSLVMQRDPRAMATCYYNERSDGPEPLLTIWEPFSFSRLKIFVENGYSSPRQFLSQNHVKLCRPASADIFRSLNNPDDIMELTEVHEGRLRLKQRSITGIYNL